MPYDHATPSAREGGIMEGFPPPPDRRVNPTNWDRYPFNRWSFQNVRQVLPTRAVGHDPASLRRLPREEADLSGVAVPVPGGGRIALERLLPALDTDGCIVLKDGAVRFEGYLNDMSSDTLHLSQSISKSLVGALVGIQIGRGAIDPESPVERYVPELARCGYAGARVTDILDMRSGVRFVEDYLDPDSEMGLLDRATGWKPARPGEPVGIYDLILTLRRIGRMAGSSSTARSRRTCWDGSWSAARAAISARLWRRCSGARWGRKPTAATRSTRRAPRSATGG